MRADTAADWAAVGCQKSEAFFAPGDGGDVRHYAPQRNVKMEHLVLDITPDFKARNLEGKATLTFRPLLPPVTEVKLDAVDLDVHSLTASEKLAGYQVTTDAIVVTFEAPLPTNKETTVTVSYKAEPKLGIYFRTPEMGYKPGDTHLFSQGEEIEARQWYPGFDAPNGKFTSEMICRVPEGMTAISNGRLVSEEKDPATGLVAIHWSQEKPLANYLVTLTAGYLKKLEGHYKELPLAFYTPASEIMDATNSFKDTADMIGYFEQEIGVPYPWAKYYQICVNDFVEGGMENTSATTLTDSTLYPDATAGTRESIGLVSHELAHQWFGDLVTCKDWGNIWLNESFATYYETLYREHKEGHDSMLYELYGRARGILANNDDTTPIVRRNYATAHDMFGYLTYPKGGWVLHMLRSELGPELYRRCIKTYLERHQYGNVVTEDLREVVEELSGRSFDQFFDQWLYHGHFPELEISYSWDEQAKLAKVSVRQTQKVDANVLLFSLPLTVRFTGKFGTADKNVRVAEREQEFSFKFDSAPELVRIDPEYTLLAKVSFTPSGAMLARQLTNQNDVIGRLLAIEQLSPKKDNDSIGKLKKALKEDAFFGVRESAAEALRGMHTDEAFEALLDSQQQPDERVRRSVLAGISGFYREKSYEISRAAVETEKNPDLATGPLRALGGYNKPDVQQTLLKFLGSDSWQNELAAGAIAGIRSQDDPAYIEPLLETLSTREAAFTSRGLAQGLTTLGYLARNEEKKDKVREFLLRHVNDKKRFVGVAAISALGTLGDAKAIGALETFTTASKDEPAKQAADRAVADLRAGRKPVDDFKNVRQEVLDLEKSNRTLKQELDELKKKVAAVTTAAATTNAPAKSSKRKSK